MKTRRVGRQTVKLGHPPRVVSYANIGGKMEGEGPLAQEFDELDDDPFFGKKTWEQGEAALQSRTLRRSLVKAKLRPEDLDVVLSGDLLNQCIGSSFGLREFGIPFYGVYAACSTIGEGLSLAAMMVDGGYANLAAAATSSHFCTAERQYRQPVPYGSQRTPTAQWTVTGAGCCILGTAGDGPFVTHVVRGRMVDMGITDAANMGAAMAPAACDTLSALFRETQTRPADYDLIVTGDLGQLGHDVVVDLMDRDGYHLDERYTDCGLLIYDREKQDMHAGGSGAGCSASVLCGHLLRGMAAGRWQRIVFAPTGALLSPTSTFQGESIPSICHAVVFESQPRSM
ncbi:MAG: stage V sporulation protein AD [Oscillospiraceae bacterium]|nr:stage V sporulation protein AD [Oscillospiraceae bacterium]